MARLHARLDKLERERDGYVRLAATGRIGDTDLDRYLTELDAEGTTVRETIESLGDEGRRLRELDALPGLVDEYLADLPHLIGDECLVREYETVPEPRTEDNPLGAYLLTPERIRSLSEEELATERLEARNERASKFRVLYEALGLSVEVRKDGTLLLSWSFGSRVLLGVTLAERSL